jgi:hypothetical protein
VTDNEIAEDERDRFKPGQPRLVGDEFGRDSAADPDPRSQKFPINSPLLSAYQLACAAA